MNKPKIAVLIDWYLPGTKAGGPVRSVFSLINLLKEYFDFYLITSNSDLGESNPYPEIKPNALFELNSVHYCYFDKSHLNKENISKLLNTINPDLIYLNSFWSVSFSLQIVRLKNKNQIKCPVLLAPRGMLGRGALRLKSLKKHSYNFLAKLFGWYRSIIFQATQEQEKTDILSVFSKAKIITAPNINSLGFCTNISSKQKNKLKLFYLSRIARVKNLHFALEVLRSTPIAFEIEYDLYGNIEDKEYWYECESLISQLPSNVKVKYISEIPFTKIQEVLPNYHCLFLPTLNENFGHSIVESLLCGCPVIISDQTPWNDVENGKAGFAINLDNTNAFVNALKFYATMDQEEFSKMSLFSQQYIGSKININRTVELYKNLFNDCIKN